MRLLPSSCLAAVIVSASCCPPAVHAAEVVTPPLIYPADTWQGRAQVVVRVLDKLDAHTETITIAAGQSGTYKSLTITAQNCLVHPPGLPPDAAASISVQDRHPDTKPFSGWMFAAEPFVDIFESPIYGVQLVSCAGGDVAPMAPPLVAAATSAPDAIVPGVGPPGVVQPGTDQSGADRPGADIAGQPRITSEPQPGAGPGQGPVDQTPDPVYPSGPPDPAAAPPSDPSAPQN